MRPSTQEQKIATDSEPIEVISVPIYPTGIYTFTEAAELIKCSYSSIRRAVESGNPAITRIGNQPRILGRCKTPGMDRSRRRNGTKQSHYVTIHSKHPFSHS